MENNRAAERYAGLIAFVIARYRLAPPAAAIVSRRVWWRFAERRGDDDTPAWLATATRQECERFLDTTTEADADAVVATATRRQALRDAVATLTRAERGLLTAPPGPARSEVLGKLRSAITTARSHH